MTTEHRALQQQLSDIFSDITQKLGGRAVWLDDEDLCLIGESTKLWISIERDGLDLYYLQKDRKGLFWAYRLSLLLAHRANGRVTSGFPQPKTWVEKIVAEAHWTVRALTGFGSDILVGDDRWIKDSGMEGFVLEASLVQSLRNHLKTPL